MERNWDPEIKKFFVKILNSVALGLFWMMASAIAGIYYELGYTNGKPLIYTIIFYAGNGFFHQIKRFLIALCLA